MTTLRQEQLIVTALKKARDANIKIVAGPVFVWTADNIDACNAEGAMLVLLGAAKKDFPKGWQLPVEQYLEVNSFWLHRFHLGWDRGHQIQYFDEKHPEKKPTNDEVSALGIKMRKAWMDA